MQSPDNIDAGRKSVVCVAGSKYTLEAVYLPVCDQLSGIADVHLYVLDAQRDYDVSTLLERKHSEGTLASFTLIPSPRHAVRHHRALKRIAQAVSSESLDMLILAGDYMPMHRYFIDVARAKKALVIGLESGAPTQLLASFQQDTTSVPSVADHSIWSRLSVAKVIRWAAAELEWARRFVVHYKVLPLLFAGRSFGSKPYERNGRILFSTVRVDAVIVLSKAVRSALQHFFPDMDVRLAEHPMASRCRCGDKQAPRQLLVTLGGPWHYYVEPGNSAEDIENRWFHAICRANEIGEFLQIDIRPHPRESDPHPAKLVERLNSEGLSAALLNPRESSLPDIVCDYAGVLGAPSGALAEAATACRRGFVIGLDQIQGSIGDPSASAYSSRVVDVAIGEELQPTHFREMSGIEGAPHSVVEHLFDLGSWSVKPEGIHREGTVVVGR